MHRQNMRKLLITLGVCAAVTIGSSFSFGADLQIYDEKGNYSYGTVERDGSVSIYDEKGNYSYGNVSK